MIIRKSNKFDNVKIKDVHLKAFGESEGKEIAELVRDLFEDKTAQPLLSLVAVDGKEIIGHILFTDAKVEHVDKSVSTRILAPLAVSPGFQNIGVGSQLIERGLEILREDGVALVFVLGYPEYYPRSGFKPAGAVGLNAPYKIPEKNEDAWMVLELKQGIIGSIKGQVKCADTLNQPLYWRE